MVMLLWDYRSQKLTSLFSSPANLAHKTARLLQRLTTTGLTCFEGEVSKGNCRLYSRYGALYLVADILGAVRVSSASASLPQLRHVWLVSATGDVNVSHKPTPGEGRREGEGDKILEFFFFSDKVLDF